VDRATSRRLHPPGAMVNTDEALDRSEPRPVTRPSRDRTGVLRRRGSDRRAPGAACGDLSDAAQSGRGT
jgi:hypothetical protein